jgi:dihydroorotate dehydrogenase
LDIYTSFLRPLLFSGIKADPERLHQQAMRGLTWLDRPHSSPIQQVRQQLRRSCELSHPALTQTLWGCRFANPIGLAAGFDKDGVAAGVWGDFGFGFAELGTVTLHPQPGNPQPRLFRLPDDRAVLNRMGFNNQGAAALATRLQALRNRPTVPGSAELIPLGINLGKSKITPLEAAVEDYVGSFRLLKSLGEYFVVNVSSPNTPGLRSLQAVEQLDPILAALQHENQAEKPLLIKIAPDLEWDEIAALVDLAQQRRLAGIIATNTTIRRDQLRTQTITATGKPVMEEPGGISGAPLRQRSTEIIRFIYQQTKGQLPIVGVGGVFTAEDAWEKIMAGASLVQLYTGWIYEGPWMVQRILRGLIRKLEEQQISQLAAAVGMGHES